MTGKIITFYSYKGGTGRTMALANIAWILASNKKRVLAIDWDLEAPGLHSYFSPFLIDYDCSSTDGLIDLFYDYANTAHTPQIQGSEDNRWYEPFLDIKRYAVSLNTNSLRPPHAVLDFVSSGRQGPDYAVKINSFDWHNFYNRLGGGTFLNKLKTRLVEEYDFILIDSRTGISDTSGICTVQLPDIIMSCFTFNNQSIDGVSAVIQSVLQQRKDDLPEIYPIPMKVELGEKNKLEKMRNRARIKFDLISSKKIKDLDDYWEKVEVLYQPYYAYEEILATFADDPKQPNTLLSSMERITSFLTRNEITGLIEPDQAEKKQVLNLLTSKNASNIHKIPFHTFLSHVGTDKLAVELLAHELERKGLRVWLDKWNLIPGESWQESIEEALNACQTITMFIGPSGIAPWENEEMRTVIDDYVKNRRVIPVLLPGAPDNKMLKLPSFLRRLTWVDFRSGLNDEDALYKLECGIKGIAPKPETKTRSNRLFPSEAPPPVGDLPLGSYMPFSPNPLFAGRIADLRKIADVLVNNAQTGTAIPQVVTGMGGVGKTQLAVEFAYRYGKYFQSVHWLNLADPRTLDSEIALCGSEMGLDNWPDDDQPAQAAMTESEWKAHGLRLLILDHFEDVSQTNDILSRLQHLNIRLLVTSRHSNWPSTIGLSSFILGSFTPEESLTFLKNALNKRKDKDEYLTIMAERLGYLPLALELASRYLSSHPRLTLDEYLVQTKQAFDHPSMLNWREDLPTSTQHDLDLQRTFALSWETLKNANAKVLFQSAGYLAPNTPIPLEIFESTMEINRETCNEALTLLYSLSLLQERESLPMIHPLLAEYARSISRNDVKILEALADTFIKLSNEADKTSFSISLASIRLHILALASYSENENMVSAGRLWNNYGGHLRDIADYAGAHAAYERALKIDETNFGLNDPAVAIDVNNLASVLQELGDLDSARVFYERALKIDEAAFGYEHPRVAIDINNLGLVMQKQGDLIGARSAYQHALKIDEVAFGPDHLNVAVRVNNLGMVLLKQGDLEGAHEAFERALRIFESNLGPDHPNVAILVNNLGDVLRAQRDFAGARAAYERALKIDEATFGIEHPRVAVHSYNLALTMQAQGDLDDARTNYERALAIFNKFLPADHPNIKIVQGNLDSLDE